MYCCGKKRKPANVERLAPERGFRLNVTSIKRFQIQTGQEKTTTTAVRQGDDTHILGLGIGRKEKKKKKITSKHPRENLAQHGDRNQIQLCRTAAFQIRLPCNMLCAQGISFSAVNLYSSSQKKD